MGANDTPHISKSALEFLFTFRGSDGVYWGNQHFFKDRKTFNWAIKYLHERKLIRTDYLITKSGLKKVFVTTNDGLILCRLLSV